MFRRFPALSLAAAVTAVFTLAPIPAAFSTTPLEEAIKKLTPEQQAILKAYEAAHLAYTRKVDQYWRLTEIKRKKRKLKLAAGKELTADDYVKEFPPVYKGPKRPDEIMALLPKSPKQPVEPKQPVAVVTDFLREAEKEYGFKPDRVSEDEFMIGYVVQAVRLGLTKEQIVRVYALETGGVGTHDLQSGYNPKTGHAASTGLGYAQLLAANSIEQLRKDGSDFASRLERLAEDPNIPLAKAQSLRTKAACMRRMIADAKKVPDNWPAHVAYARTPKGLAMHALNLDGDIGPWMQVVKLQGIKDYAAKKGLTDLTGAQLELMNLAGPGNGFEMLKAPGRDMPTSNFFERGGYARNPTVHDKTGAQLLAKIEEIMERNMQRPGAQKFALIFDRIATRLASEGPFRASAQ